VCSRQQAGRRYSSRGDSRSAGWAGSRGGSPKPMVLNCWPRARIGIAVLDATRWPEAIGCFRDLA